MNTRLRENIDNYKRWLAWTSNSIKLIDNIKLLLHQVLICSDPIICKATIGRVVNKCF